jgi:hypothetical protein
MKYQKTSFTNSTVPLDGNEFVNCLFDNCELIYQGGIPPQLSDNSFNNFKIVFRGPAANTIAFVKAMAAPDSGMQKIVRDTFPEIFGK